MRFSYYVYYRVQPQREAEALERGRALLAHVAQGSGITGRLSCQRYETNLWMEVYENVVTPVAFEAALEKAVADVRIDEVLVPGSVRKVECFRECA